MLLASAWLPSSVSPLAAAWPPSPPAAGLDPYNAETAQNCAIEIVSFTGSFHGRTMGSLALTYKVRQRAHRAH